MKVFNKSNSFYRVDEFAQINGEEAGRVGKENSESFTRTTKFEGTDLAYCREQAFKYYNEQLIVKNDWYKVPFIPYSEYSANPKKFDGKTASYSIDCSFVNCSLMIEGEPEETLLTSGEDDGELWAEKEQLKQLGVLLPE